MSVYPDKISELLNREKKTEQIQSEIRQELEDSHPDPQKAKKIIGSYSSELKSIKEEVHVLESTGILNDHRERFANAESLLENTFEIVEDVSEINNLIAEWVEALKPVKTGGKPDFEKSHKISNRLEDILDSIPKSEQGKDILENIEEIHEAIERIYREAEEGRKELKRIEDVESKNFEEEKSHLNELLEELEQVILVKKESKRLLKEKEDLEEKIEELDENIGSAEEIDREINRLSKLLRKVPEAIFKFEGVDEDVRMSELEDAFVVKERLEVLPKVLEKFESEQPTRRDILKGTIKFTALYTGIASSGLYSYLTYENVRRIDGSGGGKEVFLTGGEEKSYMNKNAVKKAVSGHDIPVNIIHIRTEGGQPSYSHKKFKNRVKLPFKKDLGLNLNLRFFELDVSDSNSELSKLISSITIGEGIDEDIFSSPRVKQSAARMIYDKIFSFEKISENMTYGNSEESPSITIIISDFKQGKYSGLANSNFSSNLALVQDWNSEMKTSGTTVHELGHKFGLPHAASPQDVMSYSQIATILEKNSRAYFSWESKYNWWKVKNTLKNKK